MTRIPDTTPDTNPGASRAAVDPVPRHVDVPDGLRRLKRRVPAGAKSAARRGLRQVGLATAGRRMLPTFLVIGTKRGGTTSLSHWLRGHPQVLPLFPAAQQIKSPHYFDLNYWRGEDWYRSHFPTTATARRAADRLGAAPAVGEASPYYLFHPAVAGRVAETAPEVRVVALLRDPVRRAWSHYWERRGSGAEPLPTFQAALAAEEERLAGVTAAHLADPRFRSEHHDWHSYLARGHYLEQLRPWFAALPRDQLLLLPSERLYTEPVDTMAQVQRFLGLHVVDGLRLDHHHRLPTPPLPDDVARRLAEHYRPHNSALHAEVGFGEEWNAT